MSIAIWSIAPGWGNINGDSGNAEVLAARARWCGVDSEIVAVAPGEVPTKAPDAIIIGSGFDADIDEVLAGLRAVESAILAAIATEAPLLAIGTGWELLSRSLELASGEVYEGLGVFGGRAVPGDFRTGDVLIDSPFGELIGYEYHVRSYELGTSEAPLGRIIHGSGNAPGSGVEGAMVGTAYGTSLRGPVLARNPRFADHVLALAAKHAGVELGEPSPELARVDTWQADITARTVASLRS